MSDTKYICLRDDDTNFFTTVEELRVAYGQYWGKVPVTLATIPFAHGSEKKIFDVEIPYEKKFENLRQWELNASADELSEYHKVHPIGDNRGLVVELKTLTEKGMIEIAQHGVLHRYTEFGAELLGDRKGDMFFQSTAAASTRFCTAMTRVNDHCPHTIRVFFLRKSGCRKQ